MKDRLFERLVRMFMRAVRDQRSEDVCELYWALIDECTAEQWQSIQVQVNRAVDQAIRPHLPAALYVMKPEPKGAA